MLVCSCLFYLSACSKCLESQTTASSQYKCVEGIGGEKKWREKGNLIINGHGPYVSFLLASCYYNEYQCNSGYCIPDVERCDGYYDCGDNSDEWNCSSGTILIIILCTTVTVFWYTPSSLLRESCAHTHIQVQDIISYTVQVEGPAHWA